MADVWMEQQQMALFSIQPFVNRIQQLQTDTEATRPYIQTAYNGPHPISLSTNYHAQLHYFQLGFPSPVCVTILFIHGESAAVTCG